MVTIISLAHDKIKELYDHFDFAEKEEIVGSSLNLETKELKVFFLDEEGNSSTYIANLENEEEKYFAILRIFQKQEAEKRLKALDLHPNVLKEFKEDGTVYYSERQNSFFDGILYWVSNVKEYEKIIKEYEETRHAVVYHAQLTRFEFGVCLSLLFVSQYIQEWEQEREELIPDENGIMHPYAYVYNLDTPKFSDLGRIGIIKKNGGISRVY